MSTEAGEGNEGPVEGVVEKLSSFGTSDSKSGKLVVGEDDNAEVEYVGGNALEAEVKALAGATGFAKVKPVSREDVPAKFCGV